MEQFGQLEPIPFQDLHRQDGEQTNHQSTNSLPNKKCSSPSPPNSDMMSPTKTNYQTVSSMDFLYGSFRGDGNISPGNHDNNEDGDAGHRGNSPRSDGEEAMGGIVEGVGSGDLLDVTGKNKATKFVGHCKVCGDDASGMYFGALVCVPCKTFFLRYYGDNFSFVCRNTKDCEINIKTRTSCKYCRMQKCLQVGMLRRVRPSQVQISEGQQLCVVCSDLANGLHFGAITCEGCKKFFRRGLKEHQAYVCKNDKDCVINPRTRNACRYCRYQKCLNAGMCREAIQMGRPSKFRGHSLYNSNLPFPKSGRSESNGAPPNPTISMQPSMRTNLQFNPNIRGGTTDGPKSLPIPNLNSQQMMNLVHNQEIKVEPPDYEFHPSPYGSYGNPSPHPDELQDSILNMSNPWDIAIKTMNQEMNSQVSNLLTSNHSDQIIEQIAQNLKYTTAGIIATETSSSLTTMSSVGEPQATSVTAVCSVAMPSLPSDMVSATSPGNYGQQSVPSPEELDMMANLQKALAVLEDPHLAGPSLQDAMIIGEHGTSIQTISVNNQPQSESGQFSASQVHTPLTARDWNYTAAVSNPEQQGLPQQRLPLGTNYSEPQWPVGGPPLSNNPPQKYPSVSQNTPTTSQQQQQQLSPLATQRQQILTETSGRTQQPSSARAIQQQQQRGVSESTSEEQPQERKVPLEEIVTRDYNSLLGVQQNSLEDFNNFMKLSQQQLIDWIEYLQKERKTISPNNHTIKAIKKDSTQEFKAEYWQKPELPNDSLLFTDENRKILNQIKGAFSEFVESGHRINIRLTKEFHVWMREAGHSSLDEITDTEFPDTFNKRVVELYTVCSVAYCKKLPGFVDFHPTDQYNIVRLGQSQSRILAAACHWYKKEMGGFEYFLSWKPKNAQREFKFKESCLKYAEMIVNREWDHVESALTNVLVLIATDYPDLQNPGIIHETRMNILRSFRAYTTAKYGTPNRRIEELFSYIPKLRELGLLHYKWTMVTVLERKTSGGKSEEDTGEDLLL